MKKLFLTLTVLLCSTLSYAQTATNADTVKVKKAIIEKNTAQATWPATSPAGQTMFVSAGDTGIYAITPNGWVRLDSAGTSTEVSSDTTINVTLAGITYTVKVDTTVIETINNSILRSDTTINVVYSPVGPDSVKVDTVVIATKADLDAVSGWYGSGADGAITPAADTTLTRDMHATDLTLNAGIDLYPAGYRIFVTGTLTIASTATINDTGATGAAGASAPANTTNSTVGASGASGGSTTGKADGYLVRASTGTVGGDGGDGSDGGVRAGTNGSNGSTFTNCIGSAGAAGGDGGGNGNEAGGTGGLAGACTAPTAASGLRKDVFTQYINRAFAPDFSVFANAYLPIRSGGGSGGGAGGARGVSGTSGGGYCIGGHGVGGSAGQNGGMIWVAARVISGTGTLTVRGGVGGAGGNGGAASGGTTANEAGNGGGGGGGANGGMIVIFYHRISAITTNIAGGTGGAPGISGLATGTGPVQAQPGIQGGTGNSGVLLLFKF